MDIYLDYNAAAPLRPEALSAMSECLSAPLNPSSVHCFGRRARAIVEKARATIAEATSVFPTEVFFCASGTEANNWALRGFPGKRVIVSAVEHASALSAADALIPVDEAGVVRLEALSELLRKSENALVSVMLANNETGVIQPVEEVSKLCRAHHALFHCDAAQAFGKIPVDAGILGADMLTLSAHKCGGPVGAAALVVRGGLSITPLLRGGAQENRLRAGTENVAAIAGFAAAVEHFDFAHMTALESWLETMLTTCAPSPCKGEGRGGGKYLPNTRMIFMPGVSAELQLMHFDLAGIALSAGSACASGKIAESHVLHAMGVPSEFAKTAIRVSGGWNTKQGEINRFTEEWLSLRGKMEGKSTA